MNEPDPASARPRPTLVRRALAFFVLLIAAWFLLKFVVHVALFAATSLVVVLAIVAAIWAVRVLR